MIGLQARHVIAQFSQTFGRVSAVTASKLHPVCRVSSYAKFFQARNVFEK